MDLYLDVRETVCVLECVCVCVFNPMNVPIMYQITRLISNDCFFPIMAMTIKIIVLSIFVK